MTKYRQKRKSVIYRRCERLGIILANLGYDLISYRDLKFLIMKHVGGDPRTVKAYRKYLQEFGFVRLVKRTHFKVMRTFIPLQKRLVLEAVEK